jgi:protein TonB
MARDKILAVSRMPALEYLGYRHFTATLILAIMLHILAFYIWYNMPHIRVIDIPVHALNIRLGDGDVQVEEYETQPQPMADNSKQVESAMTKLIRQPEKIVKKSAPARAHKEAEAPVKLPESATDKMPVIGDNVESPRQFVRAVTSDSPDKALGSELGNSKDDDASIKSRYEQTISLWIKKFQLYPESAKEQGIEGSTMIRIQIDRRGNIRYSRLEGSTGNEELDRAALDMARRANPVPAVPDNYPEGEMFGFLIPVNFNLKDR